jgi:hypothetical protein
MNRRKDSLTAFLIDAALHTSSIHGIQLAAVNMKDYGIGRDVIMRVLTIPRQRRAAGQRMTVLAMPSSVAIQNRRGI